MGFDTYGQTLMVKCGIVGDASVGKTALCQALVSDGAEFPKNYQMTTSVNLSSKIIELEETEDEICLILTDLAGENLFEPLIEPHFDMIAIVVVVFDLTNRKSFENVEKWIGKLRALDVKVPGCLIGNKDDINADRHVVTDKEARRLAENLGLKFFKTSARENIGVLESFEEMSSDLYKLWSTSPEQVPILTEQLH